MLPQETLIQRLRHICQADQRLDAAMLYGSFTYQEADQYSDVDCMLFFQNTALEQIRPREWVDQLATTSLFYKNEFGNWVAIFENLVRAEFHFDPVSGMDRLPALQGIVSFPSLEAVLILDRNGALSRHLAPLIGPPPERLTPETATQLVYGLFNWILFGAHVFKRGERARALEILHIVHDHLLRMARLVEGQTAHWLTPTRLVEKDLSRKTYRRFQACTAHLDPLALQVAYRESWSWGLELASSLAARFPIELPQGLIQSIDEYLT